jgi:hypothetical protein
VLRIRGICCSTILLQANLSAENAAGHQITFAGSTYFTQSKSSLPQPLPTKYALTCDDAKVNGIGLDRASVRQSENLSLTGAVRRRIVKVIAGTIPGKWDTAHDHDNPGEQ